MTCATFDSMCGCDLFFKCEVFQRSGSFKIRGATNAILSLSENEAAAGVCTHSSGNHAQAVALAAKSRGIKATIVMPANAPPNKIAAVRGYGAEVILCEATNEARQSTTDSLVAE